MSMDFKDEFFADPEMIKSIRRYEYLLFYLWVHGLCWVHRFLDRRRATRWERNYMNTVPNRWSWVPSCESIHASRYLCGTVRHREERLSFSSNRNLLDRVVSSGIAWKQASHRCRCWHVSTWSILDHRYQVQQSVLALDSQLSKSS